MKFKFGIWDEHLSKKHEMDILNMGSMSLENMKCKVGNMGSISSKTWHGHCVFQLKELAMLLQVELIGGFWHS